MSTEFHDFRLTHDQNRIINRLVSAEGNQMEVDALKDGITDSDGSFRVQLHYLRRAGYKIEAVKVLRLVRD